jgi:hypothetical protein
MISTVRDLVADALFASFLQPSEEPAPDAVRMAMTQTLLRLGSDGCAVIVAQEFGDHPDTAVRRMRWVRHVMDTAYAGAAVR